MAEEQPRAPLPLTGALGELSPEVGRLIRSVARARDPELAHRLESARDVSVADRDAVERMLSAELEWDSEWEPTPHGRQVDEAIGWFLHSFPIATL